MISVRIPATSANLGPAFDCMGVALDLWNTFELRRQGPAGSITVRTLGEGEDKLPTDDTNLIVTVIKHELGELYDNLPHGLNIACYNSVPCASGLGSSSTAVLAGIIFAEALRLTPPDDDFDPDCLDMQLILQRALEVEGHGDNVGPALKGGVALIMPDQEGIVAQQMEFVPFRVTVCVPDFNYLTEVARARLPKEVPYRDAVFNIGHAMLTAQALRYGDMELLQKAMRDKLHEPYRIMDIPGAKEARSAALKAGAIAVTLSGAGPGLIAFATEGHAAIGKAMSDEFAKAGLTARWWALDAVEYGLSVRRLP